MNKFEIEGLTELTQQEIDKTNGGSLIGDIAYFIGRGLRGIVEANKNNPYMDK